jgi:ferredoxin
MKLEVLPHRCQGHARCFNYIPAVLQADELGYATVLGDGAVPPDLEEPAREAATNCPEQALRVTDD